MFWDITLAIILAVLAASMGGLAGHLAATEKWHKWFFWGASLAMVVLITVQTTRNELEQAHLQNQLDVIQRNTEQPPKVNVNVPTPVVNILPQPVEPILSQIRITKFERIGSVFKEGQAPPQVNVHYENYGPNTVHVITQSAIAIAHSPEDPATISHKEEALLEQHVWKDFIAQAGKENKQSGLGSDIPPLSSPFFTAIGPSLSSEEAQSLESGDGKTRMFVVGRIEWSGGYTYEFCNYSIGTAAGFICRTHNGLRK